MGLIPLPKLVIIHEKSFKLASEMVCYNAFFNNELLKALTKNLKIKPIIGNNDNASIVFEKIELPEEHYKINIQPHKMLIQASSEIGIFYGIKTIKQLLDNGQVKCCVIDDGPDLKIRGVMLDISRNKVATLSTLKQLVDLFADLKYNHLELYVEGFSYEYKSFPEVLEAGNYISRSDYLELEKYANENFIDLVPNQNGFGHMSDWLERREYKELAECPDGFTIWGSHRPPSTLDPTNPKSFQLVKKMYDDMLPYFKSPYFNMNFDEPYELGFGKSKDKCDKTSKADVYIEYLKPLAKVVKSYNKIPMMWGDVLIHHPDAITKLPEDIIFIDWGYNLNYPFEEHAKILHDAGISFMTASGTNTWSTIVGRYDDMKGSIENSTNSVKKYQGLGTLVTDWGDIGHLQYLPFSYPGFIYGAICAWGKPDESLIKPYLDKLVGNTLSEVILKLSTYTRYEGVYRDYGSRLFSAIMWAEHATRQANPQEFFLERMKANLITTDNLEKLESFFSEIAEVVRQVDASLVQAEVKNSINLLLVLVDINRDLGRYLQKDQAVSFERSIIALEAQQREHQNMWNMRNNPAGYSFSTKRFEWLMQMLSLLDGKEKL